MQANEIFDFDQLAKLSANSPAEFAKVRASLIQQAIQTFRSKEEGYRLQGQIDIERMSHSLGEQTYDALAYKIKNLVAKMYLLAEGLHAE